MNPRFANQRARNSRTREHRKARVTMRRKAKTGWPPLQPQDFYTSPRSRLVAIRLILEKLARAQVGTKKRAG